MADGQEREWLVFLGGASGIVEVRMKSVASPAFGATGRVILGDAAFAPGVFMGAFPVDAVNDHTVRTIG